ncbi:MAG: hypothetical protein WCV67_01130 [Victivallaceae bacterium]|jgi:hypothetical protein
MKKFRYDISGNWYKGNTHLHSTASDGGKSFKELAELYKSAGYDFLFRTDHWVNSDVEKDAENYPLLWFDGVELDGKDHTGSYFHVICLGRITGIRSEDGFENGLRSARRQGAITILAHPHWCGNSLEDCIRWPFDGVEVYNHVCHWLNGKSSGLVHWDAALNHNPDVLAFAVDDAHLRPEHPGWNGGWIMVNAGECTRPAVISAIRRGNFYSSCGPEIQSIACDGTELHVTTSPVRFARLVGPGFRGDRKGCFGGQLITSFSLPLMPEWQYAYLEIEDREGRRAWTNNLFIADNPSEADDI